MSQEDEQKGIRVQVSGMGNEIDGRALVVMRNTGRWVALSRKTISLCGVLDTCETSKGIHFFLEDGKDIKSINTNFEVINAKMIIQSIGVVEISRRVYMVGKAMV